MRVSHQKCPVENFRLSRLRMTMAVAFNTATMAINKRVVAKTMGFAASEFRD